MFTVTLDWELSGKTNTRRPLSSWYSVMPSTDAIFLGISAAKQSWTAASATILTTSCFLVISEIGEPKGRVQALFPVRLGRPSTSPGSASEHSLGQRPCVRLIVETRHLAVSWL